MFPPVLRLQNKTRQSHFRFSNCGDRVILFAVTFSALRYVQTSNPNRFRAVQDMLSATHTATVSQPWHLVSSARRDSATCDSDRCCSSDHFCSALSFACTPCSLCEYDGDSVGFSCRARCTPPDSAGAGGGMWRGDRTAPRLLWLSLSPGAVDAAEDRQLVELRFAVQVQRLRRSAQRTMAERGGRAVAGASRGGGR